MSSETKVRIFGGVIAAALVLTILFLQVWWVGILACVTGAMIGWHELSSMTGLRSYRSFYYSGFAFVLILVLSNYYSELSLSMALLIWLVSCGFIFVETRFNKKQMDSLEMSRLLSNYTLGVLYCFFIFGYIAPLLKIENGQFLVFLAIALVSCGDIAAYATGRKLGRTKLWPQVSPGKTVEGALGALVGSLIAAVICFFIFKQFNINIPLSLLNFVLLALLVSPLAQLGDLVESLIKRASGTKDSGTLIPGHGGILDRTDGYLFVFALFYYVFID